MNEEMNNKDLNFNAEKKNNGTKGLLVILIVLVLCLIGLTAYKMLVFDKNNNKQSNNNQNKENNILSLTDFPLKDDQVGENGILYKSSFLKIYSDVNNIDYDGTDKFFDKELTINVNNISISLKHYKTEIEEDGKKNEYEVATLKLGDIVVYENGALNPYLIITDKYIIIRNNTIAYYNSNVDNNLNSSGEIYIYNYNFDKIIYIKNVNTYDMIYYNVIKNVNNYDGIDKLVPASTGVHAILNGSLDIAIKNNVLYYVVVNNDLRYLKYIDLSKERIEEKDITNFKKTDAISRNQNIESIMQFPLVNETIDSNVLLNSTFGNICTNLIPQFEKVKFEEVGDKINFKYNNVQYNAICTNVVKSESQGNSCNKMTLKINDNEYLDLDNNPVMIVTTDNIIISPQPEENKPNKIYILDKNGILLKTIDNHVIHFYNIYNDKNYLVGGDSSLIVYNNSLYYVVFKDDKYELREIKLKVNNISEKTIEIFNTK